MIVRMAVPATADDHFKFPLGSTKYLMGFKVLTVRLIFAAAGATSASVTKPLFLKTVTMENDTLSPLSFSDPAAGKKVEKVLLALPFASGVTAYTQDQQGVASRRTAMPTASLEFQIVDDSGAPLHTNYDAAWTPGLIVELTLQLALDDTGGSGL